MTQRSTDFDVVVIGGGAAGIAASVGAAQSGATVCLVDQYGFLGGAATNSSVLTHCGFFDQTGAQVVAGVGQQMLERLNERGVYQQRTVPETGNTVVLLDMETMKLVYDELVSNAGVHTLLHSVLVGAQTEDGAITSVEIAHRGGRRRLTGRAFVDSSGDGALIAASGAQALVADVGRRQASTMVMRVGGVHESADISPGSVGTAVERYQEETSEVLGRTSGIVVRMPVTREVMLLIVDQHCDVLDVDQLSQAELRARRLSWKYLEAVRRFLPGWEDAYLSATGPQIGIREARRLHGRELVHAEDVTSARKRPDDAIARCGWPMEDHIEPGVTEYGAIADHGWYHIPFNSIRSESFDNLVAGGRLVSSDSRAYASLRVMGTSFGTGHACGVAAATYAKTAEHEYGAVRAELETQGALI